MPENAPTAESEDRTELIPPYTTSIRILGPGAAELTYIGDNGEVYFDC